MICFNHFLGRWVGFLLSVMFLTATLARAETPLPADEEATRILQRVDRALWPDSAEVFFQVDHQRPKKTSLITSLYAARVRPDHWLALIAGPVEQRGRTLLRIGHEFWERKPGMVDPEAISESGLFAEGMFDLTDLFPLDFNLEYTARIKEDRPKEWVLELHARRPEARYPLLEMTVWKGLAVPTQVRYFSASGELLREVLYQEPRTFPGLAIRPGVLTLVNTTNKGYATRIRIGRIRSREFPPEAFSRDFLPRVGTLLQ